MNNSFEGIEFCSLSVITSILKIVYIQLSNRILLQVDLVTSVPSRKPLEAPTAAAVLRMFRASDKKSKTKSYNRDLTFYSATVRPPCKRCVRDSQRLGLRVSVVAEQAHHSFETVGHSPYDSCDPMSQSSDSLVGCSIEVTGSRSPSILYGLQRCRQVLMRNAILLPRYDYDKPIRYTFNCSYAMIYRPIGMSLQF